MNKNLRIINPKLNIVFAIYLAIIPLIMSIIDLFGPYINMYYHILFWGIAYFVCLFLSVFAFILKGGKINYKLFRNPLVITTTIMLIWIGLTSIINLTFSEELIIYLSYFLIFVCIYNLDNKWGKILLHTLLVVIAISCVMGFIDPYNKFMPGFARGQFNMSLHFSNPNYVAYILTALMLVCFCKFNYSVTLKVSIFYFIIYLVYAVTLFMNGSFVPISVLFLIEILIQLIRGIKHKHLQYKMLIMTLMLIPICLLVDLIPNIKTIRTCEYNYFLECVAVFDNIFKSNVLNVFNIETIAGSNGWNRKELWINSFKAIISSPKVFIFGLGAGTMYTYRPHNGLLSLTLDFGIVMPLIFVVFLVLCVIQLKQRKIAFNKLYLILPLISLLLCYVAGSILCFSFYVFVIVFGLLVKSEFKDKDNLN